MSLWNPENWVKSNQPRTADPVYPWYKVVNKYQTYEERQYNKTYWCTTLLHGLEQAKHIGLRRLNDYTNGFNERGEHFHPSAPLAWCLTGQGELVSVSTYIGLGKTLGLPNANCCAWPPPKPNHPAVTLECWPPMKVFAREFNSRPDMSKEDWAFETIMLTKRVQPEQLFATCQMNLEYDDENLPPYKRRNEIWLLALG